MDGRISPWWEGVPICVPQSFHGRLLGRSGKLATIPFPVAWNIVTNQSHRVKVWTYRLVDDTEGRPFSLLAIFGDLERAIERYNRFITDLYHLQWNWHLQKSRPSLYMVEFHNYKVLPNQSKMFENAIPGFWSLAGGPSDFCFLIH